MRGKKDFAQFSTTHIMRTVLRSLEQMFYVRSSALLHHGQPNLPEVCDCPVHHLTWNAFDLHTDGRLQLLCCLWLADVHPILEISPQEEVEWVQIGKLMLLTFPCNHLTMV